MLLAPRSDVYLLAVFAMIQSIRIFVDQPTATHEPVVNLSMPRMWLKLGLSAPMSSHADQQGSQPHGRHAFTARQHLKFAMS